MQPKSKVDILLEIVQDIADGYPDFFTVKGPGLGNRDTNAFLKEVRNRANNAFGQDFSEQQICGDSDHAVDFYFEDEATIVEIALGLKNPNSEFEKDILKALLAQELYPVKRLALIGKPGARNACERPGRTAFQRWASQHHGLAIDVYDIQNNH